MTGVAKSRFDRGAQWVPGPSTPRLAINELHVWLADLSCAAERDLSQLPRAERERASRFARAGKGRLWARAHSVLRALLGAYLEADPGAIRIGADINGKPLLAAPRHGDGIVFNLSHSGPYALYAFTPTGAVGIDIELARRPIDDVAVARRAFGPAFAERLRGVDRVTRRAELLVAWTRHEAIAKCAGVGIWRRSPEATKPAVAESDAMTRRPWVAELAMGAGAFGAVAAQTPPRALICWSWPPEDRDRG